LKKPRPSTCAPNARPARLEGDGRVAAAWVTGDGQTIECDFCRRGRLARFAPRDLLRNTPIAAERRLFLPTPIAAQMFRMFMPPAIAPPSSIRYLASIGFSIIGTMPSSTGDACRAKHGGTRLWPTRRSISSFSDVFELTLNGWGRRATSRSGVLCARCAADEGRAAGDCRNRRRE